MEMSQGGMEHDGRELVLNPTLEIRFELSVRRLGSPLGRYTARDLSLELCGFLIDLLRRQGAEVEMETSEELVHEAIERGILVEAAHLPPQRLAYRADLDSESIALIPRHLTRPRVPSSSGLVVNSAVHVQFGDELPLPVAASVVWPTREVVGGFAEDRPIVWVKSPGHGYMTPLWAGGTFGRTLLAVIEAGPDLIGALPSGAVDALVAAQVLIEPEAARHEHEAWKQRLIDMQEKVASDKYVVIRDILSPVQVGAARKYLREVYAAGFMRADDFQLGAMRDGVNRDGLSCFLHEQLRHLVAQVVRQPLLSTYVGMWRYRPGAHLPRHVDYEVLPGKKWHMSLCLDAADDFDTDAAWPLFVESRGRVDEVKLRIGDAVLYSGSEVPHWRERDSGAPGALTMCLIQYLVGNAEDILPMGPLAGTYFRVPR
jgi:hypothetical protein